MVSDAKFENLGSDQLNGYAIIPMLTPFARDGSLDGDAVSRMCNHILGGGCQGIMISGTTGEALSMDMNKRIQLIDLAKKSVGDRGMLLCGIGKNCLEQSVALAQAAFERGCDGVVAHLPSYYALSVEQTENWFVSLADRIEGPMFLYNIPQTTHASIPVEVIERLSHHTNIVGLKDSERDEDRQLELAHMFSERDDFAFLTGYIGMGSRIMKAGARGFVPAVGNFCPALARGIMDSYLAGDYDNFDSSLERMMQLSAVFQGSGSVAEALSAMKATASIFKLCQPCVLPPLETATSSQISSLSSAFEALDFITSEIPNS